MMKRLLCGLALITGLNVSAIDLLFNVQHATCGVDTGSVYMSIINGVPPYAIQWSNGATTSMLNGLPSGVYTVTVTDSNADEVTEVVEILQIDGLFEPFAAEAFSCAGGCDAYFYHYMPLSNATYTITFDPPGPAGSANPNGIFFTGLCAGVDYMVTVSDPDGCTGTIGPISVTGPVQPQILSTTITGSCPNGSTGSVTLVFDQVSQIYISGPDSMNFPPFANPYTINDLAPGTYTGFAYGDLNNPPIGTSCYLEFSFEIPVSTDPCGTISGIVYADLNGDCDQDPDEPGIPYQVLSIQPGDHFVLTDSIGAYSTEFPFDSYSLGIAPEDYSLECGGMPAPFSLSLADPSTVIDIALDPLLGPDVSSFVTAGTHVPGFDVNYFVSAQNNGPYTFTGLLLDLYFDPLLIAGATTGSPVLIAPGHYQWPIAELDAFGTEQYSVTFSVPANAALIGTDITATSTVISDPADAVPDNDTYSHNSTIVGAFDPNDKLAQTSSGISDSEYFIDQDNWIDYTIRFQNTGTAPAINVYLLDTISADLDMMSLEILEASHQFSALIEDGRVLRFDFPGIMLPDSSADLLGSQGFVSFRMKPIDGLILGTVVSNEADIYFDFNEPIRTNAAELVIDITVGVHEELTEQIALYPNPADEMIVLELAPGNWNIDLIGVDGRVVRTLRNSGSRTVVDLEGIAPGHYMIQAWGDHGNRALAKFVRR